MCNPNSMFGYILPDKPNLYMKDYTLYRAFYCGLCHQIGRCQGQCMRLGVNYDVTFLSILMWGLSREEPPLKMRACILNPLKKKPTVGENETLEKMAYLNALLLDFKCRDDIQDGGRRGKKVLRALMKGKVKKARAALPKVAAVLDRAFGEQCTVESKRPASWHVAADPFGQAMQEIIRDLAGEYYIGELGMLGYLLGQYVYLLDAIDDYDRDVKKKQYNPLVERFHCKDKKSLLAEHEGELRKEVEQTIAMVKENYQRIPVFATEGIITNTLWMGLMARYRQLTEENEKCLKTHTRF